LLSIVITVPFIINNIGGTVMNYVYWIYDNTCKDTSDGYVGVTKYPETRFCTHKRNNRVPKDSKIQILLEGSREDCFLYEKQLRPVAKMGWNNAVGGAHGWKIGFCHTDETKQILKEKWTDKRKANASLFRKEQNKKLIGQKRPSHSIAMTGKNNPMHGTTRPDYVKEAVRNAHLGKEPANKQQNYCPHCKKRVSISQMKKYHGPNKKACI
jgi:hypothetical protein